MRPSVFFALVLATLLQTQPGLADVPPANQLAAPTAKGALFKRRLLPEAPSSIFVTLNEDTRLSGPIRHKDGDDRAYTGAVFQLITEEAVKLSSFFLKEGRPQPFWAFLVGALTVPYHESKLQHFRLPLREPFCVDRMNSGSVLSAKSPSLFEIFEKFMKSPPEPIAPDCVADEAREKRPQLIGSFDLLSNGIMQINFLAHPDYLSSLDFLDVRRTVRSGLTQYLTGYKTVLADVLKHPCLLSLSPEGQSVVDYRNLVRGAWAGPYNNGSASRACRFVALDDPRQTTIKLTDLDRKWAAANDGPFLDDLNDVLDSVNGFFAQNLNSPQKEIYQLLVDEFTLLRQPDSGADSAAKLQADAEELEQKLRAAAQAVASELNESPQSARESQLAGKPQARQVEEKPIRYLRRSAQFYSRPVADDAFALGGLVAYGEPLTLRIIHEDDDWTEFELPEAVSRGLTDENCAFCKAGTRYFVSSDVVTSDMTVIGIYQVVSLQKPLLVHAAASRGSTIVDTVKSGEVLEVVAMSRNQGESSPWLKLFDEQGRTRWVYGQYLKLRSGFAVRK
jgi:hypothetical protein